MAVFDPGVQSNDPNYLNYPRVIDAPEPNMSKAIGIKTLSEGIQGTTKFSVDAINQGLSDKAHALVDPEREKFTSGLEAVKRQLDQGTIPAAVRSQNGSSVFDAHAEATDADLPPGLQSGVDRLSQMAQAFGAGSPKINDTQYSAATLSIAKQLRSQYPGFRDEVDAAVSKASGLPVANSYYQNLMTDINRQLTQMSMHQKQDPVAGMMLKNMDTPGDDKAGIPNMGVLYQMRQAGDPKYPGDGYVMKKISDWQNIRTQGQIDAQVRSEKDANKKDQIETETKNVTRRSNDIVSHFINDNLALAGMDSLRNLTNYFSQVAATGKYEGVPQGDAEVQARQIQLANYRNMIYQHLKNQTADSEGVMGAAEVEKVRQSAMAPIDGYLTLAGGKDANPPLALHHMNANKAIQEDAFNNTLINKDTAEGTRMLLTARKIYGDQYFPQWIQNAPPGLQEKLTGLFNQEKLFAVTDPQDALGQPLPQQRHLRDAIQHAKDLKNQSQADISKQVGGYIGLVSSITDPNMPQTMKDKLIEWGFGEKNRGLIDDIKQDYKDKDGNFVPGKFAAISRLASPAVTAAVAESARHNPENYQKYRGAIETEFGSAFRSDLGDLNKILAKPYLNLHFGWNDENGHFVLVDKNNRVIQANPRNMAVENPNQTYINTALEKLDRINRLGIDNLVKVFVSDPSASKGDIGNYLLKTLQTSGFAPGENITNASEGMAKAIVKTKKPEATLEDLDKVLGLR